MVATLTATCVISSLYFHVNATAHMLRQEDTPSEIQSYDRFFHSFFTNSSVKRLVKGVNKD
jgi:hypothetical protein